jgi:hypothetical protein
MQRKRELLLDTNACAKLVDNYWTDLASIVKQINREFRVVVSPNTFIELLNGVINGRAEYFENDKEKFRVMAGTREIKVLLPPTSYALKTVLGLHVSSPALRPSEFRRQIGIVLHARTREQLETGVKTPQDWRNSRTRLHAGIHRAKHQEGVAGHNNLMQHVREGSVRFPTPEGFARGLAKNHGYILDDDQTQRFAQALDAVYQHDKILNQRVRYDKYNFEKQQGDWIDGGQLIYLSDPALCILTDDKKLRGRVEKSTQKDRLLLLREFLKVRKFPLRH